VVRRFGSLGIDPARMTVVGLGEQLPVAPNDSFAGRDRNRRVVLVVLDPTMATSTAAAASVHLASNTPGCTVGCAGVTHNSAGGGQ
jgi:chemotaxis protein MotB